MAARELYPWLIRDVKTFSMFRKKPDRYPEGCPYCSYHGCQTMGHWRWTLKLHKMVIGHFLYLYFHPRSWWDYFNQLDYSKIEVLDMHISSDFPDFCDSYIISANYGDREMTEEEIDRLNDDSDFVYSQVEKRVYG